MKANIGLLPDDLCLMLNNVIIFVRLFEKGIGKREKTQKYDLDHILNGTKKFDKIRLRFV